MYNSKIQSSNCLLKKKCVTCFNGSGYFAIYRINIYISRLEIHQWKYLETWYFSHQLYRPHWGGGGGGLSAPLNFHFPQFLTPNFHFPHFLTPPISTFHIFVTHKFPLSTFVMSNTDFLIICIFI